MEHRLHLSDFISFLVLRRIDESFDGQHLVGPRVVKGAADERTAHEIAFRAPQTSHFRAFFLLEIEMPIDRRNDFPFRCHIGTFRWSRNV